jgi:hypothetical protein
MAARHAAHDAELEDCAEAPAVMLERGVRGPVT